ncbi:MAG: DUF4142 domain-containing protein [Thiohalocapsa sp.]
MPIRLFLSTAAVALLLAAPAVAPAQTMQNQAAAPQMTTNAGQQLSKQDQKFMKEAATGGMAEVKLGELAQQNAQDDQVKQFGAKMVQDHGQANQKLQQIASEKGVQLPTQVDKKHEQLYDRLSKLQGPAFDRAYMSAMVKDHNQDVKAFKHAQQTVKDPDLKQFAQQTLQVIEQHDQIAKNVDHSLTATGSSRKSR